MQFNRDASGKMSPLPKQSIDTGAGLERVIALKMGVDNVFVTDILQGIISEIEQVSGKKYNSHDRDWRLRFTSLPTTSGLFLLPLPMALSQATSSAAMFFANYCDELSGTEECWGSKIRF